MLLVHPVGWGHTLGRMRAAVDDRHTFQHAVRARLDAIGMIMLLWNPKSGAGCVAAEGQCLRRHVCANVMKPPLVDWLYGVSRPSPVALLRTLILERMSTSLAERAGKWIGVSSASPTITSSMSRRATACERPDGLVGKPLGKTACATRVDAASATMNQTRQDVRTLGCGSPDAVARASLVESAANSTYRRRVATLLTINFIRSYGRVQNWTSRGATTGGPDVEVSI